MSKVKYNTIVILDYGKEANVTFIHNPLNKKISETEVQFIEDYIADLEYDLNNISWMASDKIIINE